MLTLFADPSNPIIKMPSFAMVTKFSIQTMSHEQPLFSVGLLSVAVPRMSEQQAAQAQFRAGLIDLLKPVVETTDERIQGVFKSQEFLAAQIDALTAGNHPSHPSPLISQSW